MEEWEIKYIDSNFATLVQSTQCTASLLAKLRQRKCITKDESESLMNKAKNEYNSVSVTKLYDILKSRANGYDGIIWALQAEKQSGACKVLQDGSHKHEIKKLLRQPIRVFGRTKPLRDAYPTFTRKYARRLLKCSKTHEEFQSLAKKSTVLNLDGVLPEPRSLYIERRISNRRLLNPEVFKLDCDDVFVFKGVERKDLVKLVQPHYYQSSTNQRSIIKCRHIYLEDDEDWYDLLSVAESPIHLVQKENKNYILCDTSEASDAIRQYSTCQEKHEDAYVNEDAFVDQVFSATKGLLVCDIPGMGKTLLMQSLARKCRTFGETLNIHIVYLELSHLRRFLRKFPDTSDEHEAIRLAYQYSTGSSLAAFVTQHMVKAKEQIIFFMDGFDELNYVDVKSITDFLICLNRNDNVKLIISSRPNMRDHLEKTFNAVSYDILGFGMKEQCNVIVGHWEEMFREDDTSAFTEFAKDCIKSVKNIDKHGHDILGVPFRCYLLARVNENHAGLLSLRRSKRLKIDQEAIIKSTCGLYQEFIENGMRKIKSNKRKAITNFHTLKALELLFPDIAQLFANEFGVSSDVLQYPDAVRVGILFQGNQEFSHRTLADFFVGKFFAEFWGNFDRHKHSYRNSIGVYFLQQTMATSGCDFFNDDTHIEFSCPPPGFDDDGVTICWPKLPFAFDTMLYFMNNLKTYSNNMLTCILKVTDPHIQETRDSFKKAIQGNALGVVKRIIEGGLANLLVLVIRIIRELFNEVEIRDLFKLTNPPFDTYTLNNHTFVPHELLTCLGNNGSPQMAHELFGLFETSTGNCLASHVKIYLYPLKASIYRKDVDMFDYLFYKFNFPKDYILINCLWFITDAYENKEECRPLINMVDRVLALNSHEVTIEDFRDYVDSISPTKVNGCITLIEFAFKHGISAKGLSGQDMAISLWEVLDNGSDILFIKALIVFFAKTDLRQIINDVIWPGKTGNKPFTARQFLDCFEDKIILHSGFKRYQPLPRTTLKGIHELETLKVLVEISKPLDKPSEIWPRLNYVECAVIRGRVDWLEYLIEAGYIKNKINVEIALLFLSWKNPVEVMRLLIENGARVYIANLYGDNVAHKMMKQWTPTASEAITEWVRYTFSEGFDQLWTKKNYSGKVPLENLSSEAGEDHSIRKILRNFVEGCNSGGE